LRTLGCVQSSVRRCGSATVAESVCSGHPGWVTAEGTALKVYAGRATALSTWRNWASAVVVVVLAVAALYVGTAIALSVVTGTVEGVVGICAYYAATVVAPILVGARRSRSAALPNRVRHCAALSLCAHLIFVPVAIAALAM